MDHHIVTVFWVLVWFSQCDHPPVSLPLHQPVTQADTLWCKQAQAHPCPGRELNRAVNGQQRETEPTEHELVSYWLWHVPPNSNTGMNQQTGIDHELRERVCPDLLHIFYSGRLLIFVTDDRTHVGWDGKLSTRSTFPKTSLAHQSTAWAGQVTLL